MNKWITPKHDQICSSLRRSEQLSLSLCSKTIFFFFFFFASINRLTNITFLAKNKKLIAYFRKVFLATSCKPSPAWAVLLSAVLVAKIYHFPYKNTRETQIKCLYEWHHSSGIPVSCYSDVPIAVSKQINFIHFLGFLNRKMYQL